MLRSIIRGLTIIALGVLGSFISCIFIYAFGELVETNKEIAENTKNLKYCNIIDSVADSQLLSEEGKLESIQEKTISKSDNITNRVDYNQVTSDEKQTKKITEKKQIIVKSDKVASGIVDKQEQIEDKSIKKFEPNKSLRSYQKMNLIDFTNSLDEIECPVCFHCITKEDINCPHCGFKLK